MTITPRRAFMIANAVMGAACLFFIYVIAASLSNERPAELDQARQWLDHLESEEIGGAVATPEDPSVKYGGLGRNARRFTQAVYTPTPKPTPTPAPTPTPVPLSVLINSWTPVSMDETSVTILDQQTGAEFDMQLNGAARPLEAQGETRQVKVTEINLDADTPYVKFEADGDSATKNL